MQIPSQPAFYQGALANDAATGEIPPACQMHIAARSNTSAESTGDFVIAQINMRAARRANCRSRRATDLLFSLAFETLDNRAALSLPKILESSKNRGTL